MLRPMSMTHSRWLLAPLLAFVAACTGGSGSTAAKGPSTETADVHPALRINDHEQVTLRVRLLGGGRTEGWPQLKASRDSTRRDRPTHQVVREATHEVVRGQALETRLADADGARVWAQQQAREQLATRGEPVTRLAVARLACTLLDHAETTPC